METRDILKKFFSAMQDPALSEEEVIDVAEDSLRKMADATLKVPDEKTEHELIGVDTFDSSGATLLTLACLNGPEKVVQLLLTANANANLGDANTKATPLNFAVNYHPGSVPSLLAAGADVDQEDLQSQNTPLIYAAYKGDLAVMKFLLEHLADPNKANKLSGTNPLIIAAHKGHLDAVRLLLSENADPNAANSQTGTTALSYATSGGHEGVVALLLDEKEINVDLEDKNHHSALDYALVAENLEIVTLLLQKGAKIKNFENFRIFLAKQDQADPRVLSCLKILISQQDAIIPAEERAAARLYTEKLTIFHDAQNKYRELVSPAVSDPLQAFLPTAVANIVTGYHGTAPLKKPMLFFKSETVNAALSDMKTEVLEEQKKHPELFDKSTIVQDLDAAIARSIRSS